MVELNATTIIPALKSNDRAKDIFSYLPPLDGLIKLRSLNRLAKVKSMTFENVFRQRSLNFNLKDQYMA